jgi:hypothetical protein
MATLAEIRQQFPQYSDLSDQQLADGLYQKHYSDMPREEFNSKIGLSAPKAPATTADTVADVALQVPSGMSSALVSTLTAPYRALDWAGEKITGTGFLPDADKMSMYRPYIGDQSPQPQTEAGRYARAAGESVGYSAAPSAALVAAAPRMAAMAPTTTMRAMGQSVGSQVAAAPGAAVAADVASAAGSGLAQQGAQEAGFGPAGQTVAAIAGGFAPLAVGQGVAHLTQAARGARARSDPYARVASGLGDNSVDDLAGGVATGATRFDEATNRRTLAVLGEEMVRTNGDRAAAAQATVARMVAEDGISQATAQQRVRNLTSVHRDSDLMFGEYPAVAASNQATRRQRPANITDEAAARVDDVGTHWEIDNIANAGTGASGMRVRNAVTQRGEDLGDSTRQIIQNMAPNGQTIQDVDNLIQGLQRQARADYQQVHSAQGNVNYGLLHGMLRRVVDRHLDRMHGRGGEQFDALRAAINELYVETPRGRLLMPDLQTMQDMRGAIRGMITRNRNAGNDHIVSTLQPLYRDLTRIMERSSPQWAQANRRWADMRLDEVAQDLGDAFSKTAGPRFREQMTEFLRLAPEAQNVVRIHFVQKLLDQVDNAARLGKMNDLGRQFASPHMRATVRAVLGDEAGVQLARLIRDWNVATKSGKMIGGSPTAMRLARKNDVDTDLGILASIDQASVGGFRKWAMDWTINRLREGRNREVGRIVTTPMRDTPAVAENLERMRRAAARAEQLSQPVRLPPGTGGKIGGVISEGDDQDSIVGPMALEATGIPSIARGVRDVGRGMREGDNLRTAAGAGQIGLGIMPGAGLFRGGRAVLNAATGTAPRAAATMGAATLPMAAADVRDAQAGGQEKIAAAVEADPTVKRHRERLEKLRDDLNKAQAPIAGMNKASADAARERKSKPIQAEIDQLVGTDGKPGLIQQAEEQAAQNYLSNAPFRERYPGRAEALLYGGGALAAGLPLINTMRHKWADRFVHGPAIERQAQRVEDAARGTVTEPSRLARAMGAEPVRTPASRQQFDTEQASLQNMIAAREARAGKADWKSSVLPSAAVIAEARMLPEEIDALSYPPGHPARVAAEEKLTSLGYYAGAVVPSLLGGGAAAYYGNKVGSMASPATMATPRGEAAASMRFRGERAPEAPSRFERIKEALTQRAESWLRPRFPEAPASAGVPAVQGGGLPASLPAGGQIHQPHTLPPSPSPTASQAPGTVARQGGQQGASSAQQGSSSVPKYGETHKEITQKVMESYMRSGSVPPAAQMRDDIAAAFKRAGVDAPGRAEVTKSINITRPMLEAAKDAPQDVKDRILKAMRDNKGFLAIPLAGAGAAAMQERQ